MKIAAPYGLNYDGDVVVDRRTGTRFQLPASAPALADLMQIAWAVGCEAGRVGYAPFERHKDDPDFPFAQGIPTEAAARAMGQVVFPKPVTIQDYIEQGLLTPFEIARPPTPKRGHLVTNPQGKSEEEIRRMFEEHQMGRWKAEDEAWRTLGADAPTPPPPRGPASRDAALGKAVTTSWRQTALFWWLRFWG